MVLPGTHSVCASAGQRRRPDDRRPSRAEAQALLCSPTHPDVSAEPSRSHPRPARPPCFVAAACLWAPRRAEKIRAEQSRIDPMADHGEEPHRSACLIDLVGCRTKATGTLVESRQPDHRDGTQRAIGGLGLTPPRDGGNPGPRRRWWWCSDRWAGTVPSPIARCLVAARTGWIDGSLPQGACCAR